MNPPQRFALPPVAGEAPMIVHLAAEYYPYARTGGLAEAAWGLHRDQHRNGLNTMAIVLEVPSSSFGSIAGGSLHLWGRTRKGRFQVDRMGRPAINTVLITASGKDQFNSSSPADDLARFRPLVFAAITVALGRDEASANAIADALLPDVLAFDPTSTAGFLNGRRLEDDVIDIELKLLTGNDAASDFVGNDSAFRSTFPYLAPPN